MGKFRAEIIIKQNEHTFTIIPFEFDTIQDLSTRTMATNNPTQHVFDVLSNQGWLGLKDKDLNLYNNAINGVFDNAYQFEVLLYKGNVLIAKHIINQRPFYDFANKTLTLSLGNSIDNFDNVLYKGFEYPLMPTTIQNIQENILTNVFGVHKTEVGERPEPTYSFETIFNDFVWNNTEASVAYLPEMSSKEAMTKTLKAIGCSMIETPTVGGFTPPRFKLIDMLGRETEGKVYKLLPKHTRKSFTPNIILDNRFSNVAVNATNLKSKTETQTIYNLNINNENIKENITLNNNSWSKTENSYTGSLSSSYLYFGFIGISGFEKTFYNLEQYQDVYQNKINQLQNNKRNQNMISFNFKQNLLY